MQKCLEIKIKALPLHPQSETNTLLNAAKKKVLRKNFLKKVSKKFGGSKNLPYLCTTFRFEIMKHESELKTVL